MFNFKINLKRTAIITICLLFAFSMFGFAVYFQQNKEMNNTQITIENNEVENVEENEFSHLTYEANFQENKKPTIAPMSDAGTSEGLPMGGSVGDGAFYWVEANPKVNFSGGVAITITENTSHECDEYCSEHCSAHCSAHYEVKSGDTTSATLHVHKHYKLEKIEISPANLTYTPGPGNSFSKTPEEIDPDYTGQITFTAIVNYYAYEISYYTPQQAADGGFEYVKADEPILYTIEGLEINETTCSGLNLYILEETDHIYSGTGFNIAYTDNHSVSIKDINGSEFYKFTAITAGSYGNFGPDQGNSSTEPKVINIPELDTIDYTYNFVIHSRHSGASTYWDLGDKFGAADAFSTEGEERVYFSVGENDYNGTHLKFKKSNKDSVFAKFEKPSGDYALFNYGYYITVYTITFNGKYLTYNSGQWILGANASTVSAQTLNDVTFGTLAAFLNERSFGATSNVVNIIPTWAASTIRVGKANTSTVYGTVTYADLYNFRRGVGLYAYKTDKVANIALNARWNYENITGYVDSSSGIYGEYDLKVTPCVLNLIYGVKLNSPSSEFYKIVDENYAFNLDTYKATNGVYDYYTLDDKLQTTYKDASGSNTKYSVETYVTNVLELAGVAGRFEEYYNNNFDNEVFVNAGTVSEDDKKLTGSANMYVYLVNNTSVSKLPQFTFDDPGANKKVLVWEYSEDPENSKKYYGDNSGFIADVTRETGAWVYLDDSKTFNPYYVYSVDFYYEDNDGNNVIYSRKDHDGWYQANTTMGVPAKPSDSDIIDGKIFKGWMIHKDNAADEVNDYTVVEIEDEGKTQITLTKGDVTITFTLKTGETDGTQNTITAIQGNGLFVQNSAKPIIIAKLYREEIDFTINNNDSSIYWKNYETTETDYELFGAGSKNGDDDGYDYTTTVTVSASDSNAFYTHKGNAFKKKENLLSDPSLYYVYNYGHEVAGYKIADNKTVPYLYTSTERVASWQIGGGDSDINTLNSTNLQALIAVLNEKYAYEPGFDVSVIMSPTWQAVKVNVSWRNDQNEELGSTEITYAGGYSDLASSVMSTGQTRFALNAGSKYIALSGTWNYLNLTYAYDDTQTVKYSIITTPVFLDNIYKVHLSDVKTYSVKSGSYTYKLAADGEYEFYGSTGSYQGINGESFPYNHKITNGPGGVFKEYQSGLIDNYINRDFLSFKTDWEEGINGDNSDDFNIFNFVYHTNGTPEYKQLTGSTGNVPAMFIYLAHNQTTNSLPLFENEHYVHILWENVSIAENANPNYIYKTANFVNEHKDEIYDGTSAKYSWHGNTNYNEFDIEDEDSWKDLWKYTDGFDNSDKTVTLKTYYFRKYIDVSIRTLFDKVKTTQVEEELARHGYVHVYINDTLYEEDFAMLGASATVENQGGNFVIIVDESADEPGNLVMKVYKINNGVALNNSTLTPIEYVSLNNVTLEGEYLDSIKLYAGCTMNLNIKDQSQDPTAMSSGNFDDMIGYKYKADSGFEQYQVTSLGGVTTKEAVTLCSNSGGFVWNVAADFMKNYQTGDEITIDVYFTEIEYDVTFALNNKNYGQFKVSGNGMSSGIKDTSYTWQDINVGNIYSVEYLAYAGYTLEENAFVLNENASLKGYDDTQENDYEAQIYTLSTLEDGTLEGSWLRAYVYSAGDYGYSDTNIGTITIMAKPIEFTYGIKFYDPIAGEEETSYIIQTTEGVKSNLKALDSIRKVQEGLLANRDSKGFLTLLIGESEPKSEYALISSRLYFPGYRCYEQSDLNKYTTYRFLLLNDPDATITLTSELISLMVENYEEGKIISCNDRNIYSLLEVGKLRTIVTKVYYDSDDSNDTVRKVTVTNGNSNNATLTLNSNTPNNGTYFSIEENGDPLQSIIYTYNGLNNYISYEYDESRYDGVDFYKGNVANEISDNNLIVDKDDSNVELLVRFNLKSLDIEYSYMIDGESVDLSELSSKINEIDKPTHKLHLGNDVVYEVECVDDEWNLQVVINDNVIGTTDHNTRNIETNYEVGAYDFTKGKVLILVSLTPMQKETITIDYVLKNSAQREESDDYGTFSVYSEWNAVQTEEQSDVATTSLQVLPGRKIIVEPFLNLGYRFVGYKHNAFAPKDVELTDGKFVLIDDFELGQDNGSYLIVIEKVEITATLNTEGLLGTYTINGQINLSGLYVGKDINFANEDVNEERLDYFYYEYVDSEPERVVIDNDIKKIQITSDLIDKLGTNMQFSVVVVKRFKVDFTIQGMSFVESYGYHTKSDASDEDYSESYVSGTYLDNGSQVTFSLTTKASGKYNVYVTIDGAENGPVLEINKKDSEITLNNNHYCIIRVVPKEYSVEVDEWIYDSLTSVETNTPIEEPDQVNGLVISGQKYLDNAQVIFNRAVEDRELSRIVISGNDMIDEVKTEGEVEYTFDGVVVDFDGVNYSVKAKYITADESVADEDKIKYFDKSLSDYGLTLVLDGNKIKISYITSNDVAIRLEYKDYKIINKQ